MDFSNASPNGLRSLYDAIAIALREDDRLPPSKKRFGVRQFPDWRAWATALERAMDAKGVSYTRITW